ncbi:MAG: hypothetical protein QXL15_02210, partial [Candidatus Korarchaeota archaeon]
MKGFLYSAFIKRLSKNIIKRATSYMKRIPFYREKLLQHKVRLDELDSIRTPANLNKFFDTHKIEFLTTKDLVSYDFSQKLSIAPPEKRVFLQESSGYHMFERIQSMTLDKIKDPLTLAQYFERKRVAYTNKDMDYIRNYVIKPLGQHLNLTGKFMAIIHDMGDMNGGVYWF